MIPIRENAKSNETRAAWAVELQFKPWRRPCRMMLLSVCQVGQFQLLVADSHPTSITTKLQHINHYVQETNWMPVDGTVLHTHTYRYRSIHTKSSERSPAVKQVGDGGTGALPDPKCHARHMCEWPTEDGALVRCSCILHNLAPLRRYRTVFQIH